MSESFRIALLQPADAPAYKVLRDASLKRTPEAFSTDYATAVVRPPAIYAARFGTPAGGMFYLGAFDAQNALIGSLGFEREGALFKRHCANINAVMVTEHAERRGVARQLLEACIQMAEPLDGLELLLLGVTASNTRAVRLYENAGFAVYGQQPRAIVVAGVGHDQILMARPLSKCPPLRGEVLS